MGSDGKLNPMHLTDEMRSRNPESPKTVKEDALQEWRKYYAQRAEWQRDSDEVDRQRMGASSGQEGTSVSSNKTILQQYKDYIAEQGGTSVSSGTSILQQYQDYIAEVDSNRIKDQFKRQVEQRIVAIPKIDEIEKSYKEKWAAGEERREKDREELKNRQKIKRENKQKELDEFDAATIRAKEGIIRVEGIGETLVKYDMSRTMKRGVMEQDFEKFEEKAEQTWNNLIDDQEREWESVNKKKQKDIEKIWEST